MEDKMMSRTLASLVIGLSLLIGPAESFADNTVNDVAILCTPRISDPCSPKYVCRYNGRCECSHPYPKMMYTLNDGSQFCTPEGYDDDLVNACILKNFPSKSVLGKVYNSYDFGLGGPYGFIFDRRDFGSRKVKIKWVEDGVRYENVLGYTAGRDEVEVQLFGKIDRQTLKNRGSSCEISSEQEIDRAINSRVTGPKRKNKF